MQRRPRLIRGFFEAMVPYLKEHYGNASSVHALGRKARFAIEESRERIAAHLNVTPGEIIFTSGATEANNLAIQGVMRGRQGGLIVTETEHEAVLRPAELLERNGGHVTFLKPDSTGAIDVARLQARLTDQTTLVSCMHANNEIGVLNPVEEVGQICRSRGVLLHSDAVQSMGLLHPEPANLGVDLMSASAHKFYGPKGIGFLFVRSDVKVSELIAGGSQERKRRGGTENVAGVVGMAMALDLAIEESGDRVAHLKQLRALLLDGLKASLENFMFMSPEKAEATIPHIVNIGFPPVDGEPLDGEMLILNLDMAGVMASSGSACTSGTIEPSHVLLAMGVDRETASAALRFSLGKDTSREDIEVAIDKLSQIIKRMRTRVTI